MPHHNQVELSLVGLADDQLCGVPRKDLDLDSFLACLIACQPRDRSEERILFALRLVDSPIVAA